MIEMNSNQMSVRRISKKDSSIARKRAIKIINDAQKLLKEKYIFAWRMVGSGAWGTMIEDQNGEYDLDYQLLLTRKSKAYKDNKLSDPTAIKNDFISAFNRVLKGKEKIENSTTAITLINEDGKPYHIDFVIIRLFPENNEIIRRNNRKETPSYNEFTWNQLPGWNEAYDLFRQLPIEEKRYLVDKVIIPKKALEKAKSETDPSKLSSSALFVREVNNYICQSRKR